MASMGGSPENRIKILGCHGQKYIASYCVFARACEIYFHSLVVSAVLATSGFPLKFIRHFVTDGNDDEGQNGRHGRLLRNSL